MAIVNSYRPKFSIWKRKKDAGNDSCRAVRVGNVFGNMYTLLNNIESQKAPDPRQSLAQTGKFCVIGGNMCAEHGHFLSAGIAADVCIVVSESDPKCRDLACYLTDHTHAVTDPDFDTFGFLHSSALLS